MPRPGSGWTVTIHSEHPFLDPTRSGTSPAGSARWGGHALDERLGASGGLTVSSVMVAGGEPGRVLALVDPDSDLRDVLEETGRAVVHLLEWEHRDLAEAFAGQLPGARWRRSGWASGSRPRTVRGCSPRRPGPPSSSSRCETVGWSDLVVARIERRRDLGDDGEPLVHRRGRYLPSGIG